MFNHEWQSVVYVTTGSCRVGEGEWMGGGGGGGGNGHKNNVENECFSAFCIGRGDVGWE